MPGSDKLELTIEVTGMAAALAEITRLGDHAQKMMDAVAARGGPGGGSSPSNTSVGKNDDALRGIGITIDRTDNAFRKLQGTIEKLESAFGSLTSAVNNAGGGGGSAGGNARNSQGGFSTHGHAFTNQSPRQPRGPNSTQDAYEASMRRTLAYRVQAGRRSANFAPEDDFSQKSAGLTQQDRQRMRQQRQWRQQAGVAETLHDNEKITYWESIRQKREQHPSGMPSGAAESKFWKDFEKQGARRLKETVKTGRADADEKNAKKAGMMGDDDKLKFWQTIKQQREATGSKASKQEDGYWKEKAKKDDAIFRGQQRQLTRDIGLWEQRRKSDVSRVAKFGAGTAVAAGLALSGSAIAGFHNTVEGNRFTNELGQISRELAGVFKPTMEFLTEKLGKVRQWLSGLTVSQQDNLQYAGLAAAGGYGAYKTGAAGAVGSLWNMAKGGGPVSSGFGMTTMAAGSNAVAATRFASAAALIYGGTRGVDTLVRTGDARKRGHEIVSGGKFTTSEMAGMQDLIQGYDATAPSERQAYLRRQNAAALEQQNQIQKNHDSRTFVGMMASSIGINPWRSDGVDENLANTARLTQIRRMQGDDEFQRTGVDPTNPYRRQVMSTDTVGFGGVGSAADLMQEEILKTGAGEKNAAQTAKEDAERAEAEKKTAEESSTTNDLLRDLIRISLLPVTGPQEVGRYIVGQVFG